MKGTLVTVRASVTHALSALVMLGDTQHVRFWIPRVKYCFNSPQNHSNEGLKSPLQGIDISCILYSHIDGGNFAKGVFQNQNEQNDS